MLIPQGSVSGQDSLVFLSDYWAVVQQKHSTDQEEFKRMCHEIEINTWIAVQQWLPDDP